MDPTLQPRMTLPHSYSSVSGAPAGIEASPRRRQTPNRPPNLLTSSLGNARNAGLGLGAVVQTPASSTSLSAPFSAYPQYPYPKSPAGAMRGTSPMTSRSASAFTGQYNPQQWGAVNNVSPNSISMAGEHRQISHSSRTAHLAPRPVGPDGKEPPYLTRTHLMKTHIEPVASPPPPYSPRRDQPPQDSPPRTSDIIFPTDPTSSDTESSQQCMPVSAAATLSPDPVLRIPGGRSPVLRQHASPNDSLNAASTPFPLPPGTAQRLRAGSKPHADRLLTSLTLRGKKSKASLTGHAIDVLQDHAVQMLAQASSGGHKTATVHPPAARRAASTGGIGLAGASSRSTSHSPSPITWEPNMPLPPPPPRPPPASARSQSLNRPISSPSTVFPLRSRHLPGTGTSLDTVPPTPADWREEDGTNVRAPSRERSHVPSPLHIDTGSIVRKRRSGADHPTTASTHPRRDSSAGGLFRSPAVRNRSAMGIRERRSESRNGKARAIEDDAIESPNSEAPWVDDFENVRPTNLVLSTSQVNASRQKVTAMSATPNSGESIQSLGALNSPEMQRSSGKAVSFPSSHTTPQPGSSWSQPFSAGLMSSPISSPGRENVDRSRSAIASPSPPRRSSLPPSKTPSGPAKALSSIVPPEPEQRPLSHLLHSPNPGDSMQVPLTPLTKAAPEPLDLLGPESPKLFAGRAIERHRIFAEREAAAGELPLVSF